MPNTFIKSLLSSSIINFASFLFEGLSLIKFTCFHNLLWNSLIGSSKCLNESTKLIIFIILYILLFLIPPPDGYSLWKREKF